MLTCECDTDFYGDPGDWYWCQLPNYTTIHENAPLRKRRMRCWSCKDLIGLHDVVIAFQRDKIPESEVEINIYGEYGEVPLPEKYHCEICADLFLSLSELGFCGMPYENQHMLVKEYAEMAKNK